MGHLFATKASSTDGDPDKELIEKEVMQLRARFEQDVGSLYHENLKRKAFLQIRVYVQLGRLDTHRHQLSQHFHYKTTL